MFAKILLIESNQNHVAMVKQALEQEEFHLSHYADPEEGILNLQQRHYDIVVLNPTLSKKENLVRKIRELSDVPLIVISPKDKEVDVAIHLEDGADDFVKIPFSKVEVVARLKSLHRRVNGKTNDHNQEIFIPPYTIKMNLFEVYKGDELIPLTKGEYNILLLLASNPNKVFTKEEIYNRIWKDDYIENPNALNVHIHHLRHKLEKNPKKPEIILTKWGIGFKIGRITNPSAVKKPI
jgi:DNA-binding response OmpR family regulator